MIYLSLPPRRRRLTFYLATEEWAARALPAGDYFFAWRVEPTVICGRNQEIDKEFDLEYCRREGIDIVRRKSGGGAVYADMDNYMFSYICPVGAGVEATFARYTTMVARMLQSLGIPANANGRNDIVVEGRKVSGNAFYHIPGRAIVHGTMLYNFDPTRLARALTPSRAKMESKAVVSVHSRVTSLTEQGLQMGHEEFENYAINYVCDSERPVTEAEIAEIQEIEKTYLTPEHLYGRIYRHEPEVEDCIVTREAYLEGVGEMKMSIALGADGCVAGIGLSGDFFVVGDPETLFLSRLRGLPYRREAIAAALEGTEPSEAVAGLTRECLLNLIID